VTHEDDQTAVFHILETLSWRRYIFRSKNIFAFIFTFNCARTFDKIESTVYSTFGFGLGSHLVVPSAAPAPSSNPLAFEHDKQPHRGLNVHSTH
jgi:hypothetical protein